MLLKSYQCKEGQKKKMLGKENVLLFFVLLILALVMLFADIEGLIARMSIGKMSKYKRRDKCVNIDMIRCW
jgi:hypothetical protein